jgi:hypothetical protein
LLVIIGQWQDEDLFIKAVPEVPDHIIPNHSKKVHRHVTEKILEEIKNDDDEPDVDEDPAVSINMDHFPRFEIEIIL